MKAYAIRHNGEKTTYVEVNDTDSNWDLVKRLNSDCVLNKDQADGFLRRPGTDPRYERIELSVTVLTPRKRKR